MNKLALGIDIGGTNTVFGIVNENGDILYESSIKTKGAKNMETIIDEIYNNVSIQKNIGAIIGIGVGAPNGNYFSGNIEFAPNLPWHGIILLKEIVELKFKKPCVVTNDANAAAIGEMIFGVATKIKDFVTITLGTGVGSGVIINGEMVYGHDGFAGEYGHIRIIPNGRTCGCGRKGCLETYVSATGVVRSISELPSNFSSNSSLLKIENPSAKNIFDEAKNGDLFAQEIVEYTANILGNALADYACFSSPKAYVLFGGLAQNGEAFIERIKYHMNENILNIYKNKIEILVSSLHDKNAAVLGAAAMIFKSN